MGRRSFFFKDYVAHLVLIVCAFALAGVVFCYQMSSYALHAKQTELRTTVQSLAEQSKLLEGTDSDVIRQIYMLSIARVAKEDELTVLITDADGNIEMGAKPDGTTYTLPGYHISAEVVAEMHKNGSYASVGSLGVLSESSFYTVGTCVKDDNGDADLMIFVSTQDPNSAGVVRHSTQTLVLIMLVTLVVMLVISFMISQHVTRPLKTIAAAAKEFAGGNFDVRVPEDNRCYEIDELAVSFNNMARDLDQLEELTRGFISNVSHEFKTPIAAIQGSVKLLTSAPYGKLSEEKFQKYTRLISDETDRMASLSSNLLRLSRLENQSTAENPTVFSLDEQIRRCILLLENQWHARHIDLDIQLDRADYRGDEELVQQLWLNLLSNAIKFTGEGGNISVKLRRVVGGLRVEIADDGIGMSPETQQRIFEKFYQGDGSHSREGNGLGLSIVKRILDLHGGAIKYESAPGAGTTCTVTLPDR